MIKIDLTGQRFGKVVVLSQSRLSNGHIAWLCKCDCGTEKIIRGQSLRQNSSVSCGCTRGHETKPRSPESAFNRLFWVYKNSAKKMKREFSLSEAEFRRLTSSYCNYCGASPSQIMRSQNKHWEYKYNGIDRQDNKLGYTLVNSVTCCGPCNMMKKHMSVEDFRQRIRDIYYWLFD